MEVRSIDRGLTTDQSNTLSRLEGLLRRRSEIDDPGRAFPSKLIHALDEAIVSDYQLACELGLEQEARALLWAYRAARAAEPASRAA